MTKLDADGRVSVDLDVSIDDMTAKLSQAREFVRAGEVMLDLTGRHETMVIAVKDGRMVTVTVKVERTT